MKYICSDWTCSNIDESNEKGTCHKCGNALEENLITKDIEKLCEMSRLYVESHKYDDKEKECVKNNIENIETQLKSLFFKSDEDRTNTKVKTFYYSYGLVDTYVSVYRRGTSVMDSYEIDSGEFISGSIKVAQKRATQISMENKDILQRFSREQPQWTRIYELEKLSRRGMTRLFKRDVEDTGKVAYIHISWDIEK